MSGTAFDGLDPCVHCGFCLQACPTFVETGDEADSPRGRIVLMQRIAAGASAPDRPALHHLDRCLGCRACESACPSGVVYGHALEEFRARTADHRPIPWPARVVMTTMADARIRRPALAVARLMRPLARRLAGTSIPGFALGSLGATTPAIADADGRRTPRPIPATPSRGDVVVFTGCIMEGLFDHVHAATIRVLEANGYRVVPAPGQECCGALHAHAGDRDAARQLGLANLEAFSRLPDDTLVAVNSAGCGAMLKEYDHLFAQTDVAPAADGFSRRVRDISELLVAAGPAPGGPVPLSVAYDAPCHLHHAQRVTDAPRQLLEAIPDLRLVFHAEPETCCGSAGLYSIQERRLSRDILARKVAHLLDAAPDVVATGNPGCAMHLGAGLAAAGADIPVVHPVELLDLSYRTAG